MTTTTETTQQIFAPQIVSLISDAYNCGVLQFHPMTICGITAELTIYNHFNQLTLRYNGRLMSVSIYDEDSEEAQFASIQNLLADIIV